MILSSLGFFVTDIMRKTIFILLFFISANGVFLSCSSAAQKSTLSADKNISLSADTNITLSADTIPDDEGNWLHVKTLVAVGDNLYDWYMLEDGRVGKDSFNFDRNYDNISRYLRDVDYAIVNQETPLGGDGGYLAGDDELKYIHSPNRWGSYHGYDKFNSPDAVGHALVKAGFNVVTMATNHVLDHGVEALKKSVDFWDQYPEIELCGIRGVSADTGITVIGDGGLSIALLNYTYGVNCDEHLRGNEYCVDILEENKIMSDVARARKLADFVVVLPHWGTEYRMDADNMQQKYTRIFLKAGVDVVIGAHPHIVEPVEWLTGDDGHKMLVYYSLGNFISMFRDAKCQLEGMASITFYKEDYAKYVSGSVIPLVNHWEYDPKVFGGRKNFTVYRLSDYTEELARRHGCLHYKGGAGFSKKYMETLAGEIWGDALER